MKRIISIIIMLVFFTVCFSKSNILAAEPSPTSFPSSYELFYPVVAGKTLGDKFYFLKTAREWIVDKLITNPIKKADYHLILSKKRIVEAEELINQKNYSLAKKSITSSIKEITKSADIAKRAKNAGTKVVDINATIKKIGENEAGFIDTSLTKNIPESEKQFFLDASKAIRDLILQI